ncbi:Response regulator receiver domain-containing protein [Nitrosospira sp. Nl5]|nr:Response regulator receiver domain-containing protein [Nitrosospira sp. Nl5]
MDNDIPMLHILLAEDNPADVLLVREALNEAHIACNLHVMKDGEQVIQFIESLDADPAAPPLDMLLLDMHLPKRDGEEILNRLRSTEHYSQTPVIVMTASEAPRDYDDKKHITHYFRKPSSLSDYMQLGAIVREIAGNNCASSSRMGSAA